MWRMDGVEGDAIPLHRHHLNHSHQQLQPQSHGGEGMYLSPEHALVGAHQQAAAAELLARQVRRQQLQHAGEGRRTRREVRRMKSYLVLGDCKFEVDARYSIIDVIGQGAYGVVCAARDEYTGTDVAIKKINAAFEHVTYTKRTVREVRLLRFLRHENILRISTILRPLRLDNFQDLYVVSELMETDLSSIIKSPQPLTDEHVCFFMYQLLRGVQYLHSSNVIHRDLKPRNLLVNSNCDLKICDFGLARIDFPEMSHRTVVMTDYVATRWYRAPEILFGLRKYGKAVDMWSVGCILGELLGRKPIFPGKDSYNQLELVLRVLGTPSESLFQRIRNDRVRTFIHDLPQINPLPFSALLPHANPLALDLLARLLTYEPETRLTAEEALRHSYLSTWRVPEDETPGTPIPRAAFDFERRTPSFASLREEIVKEIRVYHPPRMEERPIDFPMPLDSVIGGDAEMNGTGPDWIWDQPRYSSEEILLEDALASELEEALKIVQPDVHHPL